MDKPKKERPPAKRRIAVSNSFSTNDVALVTQLFAKLRAGTDTSTLVQSKLFNQVEAKFHRMRHRLVHLDSNVKSPTLSKQERAELAKEAEAIKSSVSEPVKAMEYTETEKREILAMLGFDQATIDRVFSTQGVQMMVGVSRSIAPAPYEGVNIRYVYVASELKRAREEAGLRDLALNEVFDHFTLAFPGANIVLEAGDETYTQVSGRVAEGQHAVICMKAQALERELRDPPLPGVHPKETSLDEDGEAAAADMAMHQGNTDSGEEPA